MNSRWRRLRRVVASVGACLAVLVLCWGCLALSIRSRLRAIEVPVYPGAVTVRDTFDWVSPWLQPSRQVRYRLGTQYPSLKLLDYCRRVLEADGQFRPDTSDSFGGKTPGRWEVGKLALQTGEVASGELPTLVYAWSGASRPARVEMTVVDYGRVPDEARPRWARGGNRPAVGVNIRLFGMPGTAVTRPLFIPLMGLKSTRSAPVQTPPGGRP